MKIAIASDDGINIASHFGRTRGFIIFNIEDASISMQHYRDNTFTGHARGLAGQGHEIDRHAPIIDALKDCNVIIAKGMGRRIYDDLQHAGKEVIITDEDDAKYATELYIRDQLVNRHELACSH